MPSTVNFDSITSSDLHHADSQGYVGKYGNGLSEDLVRKISAEKSESAWVLKLRLESLKKFYELPIPSFGPDLADLDLEKICYYATATDQNNKKSWDEVPSEIKQTFERLKIPEAERAVLAGVGAQYDSENVYHRLKDEWCSKGVIFEDFDVAIREHGEKVREYFSRVISLTDHKFAALHYAIFSGGTFLYVPEGVTVSQPLQAYFRMNARRGGQFEHTLIIVEKNASVEYIEGCSAPKFGAASLHAGGVEVVIKEGARCRYSSVENWSPDTYNLNTKRAVVHQNARMEWIGGNLGSGRTMLYPCSLLVGKKARAEHLGVAFANGDQNQDTGAKIFISAPDCRASVISKSLSKNGGITTYRGMVDVNKSAENAIVTVECDALMLDDKSVSDTIPTIRLHNNSAQVNHEACAGKISAETLQYFASRGIDEETAKGIIVNGFLNEIVKTLPLEYASELNRLIELEMEGSVG